MQVRHGDRRKVPRSLCVTFHFERVGCKGTWLAKGCAGAQFPLLARQSAAVREDCPFLCLLWEALGFGWPLLHMGTYLQLEAASLSTTTRAAVPLLASWDLAHVMQHLLKPKCLKNLPCPHCVDQVASFTLTAPGGCTDRYSHGASGP